MKVFVLGNSPLPNENSKVRPAAGLRTQQFVSALRNNPNLDLKIVCIAMPECHSAPLEDYKKTEIDGIEVIKISKDCSNLIDITQSELDKFNPDCIVSINTYPSYVAAQLKTDKPLWTDLNGWIMAEGQAQAFKMDNNDYLPHYFLMQKVILQRADKISTVSQAQKLAVIGELAGLGRLTKETFEYELVHAIPNASEWFKGEKDEVDAYNVPGLPEEAFSALWIGGYNTWVDEVTLFKALEFAMKSCKKLYFVSTGGSIRGLDNKTFEKFRQLIHESEFKDRFIFLGWLNTEDIPSLYKRGHIGINVDRKCIETITGARNRINEMMKFGLPVVTTAGSEISYEVARVQAGRVCRSGDSEGLARAIKELYELWQIKPRPFRDISANAQKYMEEECNYQVTTKALLKWLEEPKMSPDKKSTVDFSRRGSAKAALLYLKQNGLKRFSKKLWQRIK